MKQQTTHPLAKQDINQLISLCVILKERNLSRAAKLLEVTQSAMSHNLSKARAKYGDDLLVRQGQGMVRTPFAEVLLNKLEPLVEKARLALDVENTDIEPLIEQRVTIAMPSVLVEQIGCALYQRVSLLAPHLRLNVVSEEKGRDTDLIIGDKTFDFEGESLILYQENYAYIDAGTKNKHAFVVYSPCAESASLVQTMINADNSFPVVETENWFLFSQLLGKGFGNTILPFSLAKRLAKENPNLKILETENSPRCQWFMYKKSPADKSRAWLDEQIRELLLDFFRV